jgi:hypothetical protein
MRSIPVVCILPCSTQLDKTQRTKIMSMAIARAQEDLLYQFRRHITVWKDALPESGTGAGSSHATMFFSLIHTHDAILWSYLSAATMLTPKFNMVSVLDACAVYARYAWQCVPFNRVFAALSALIFEVRSTASAPLYATLIVLCSNRVFIKDVYVPSNSLSLYKICILSSHALECWHWSLCIYSQEPRVASH